MLQKELKDQDSIIDGPCDSCGRHSASLHADVFGEAQLRIAELEAQVSFLTLKAAAAADKLADCEDIQRRNDSRRERPSTESRNSGSDLIPPQTQRQPSTGSFENSSDNVSTTSDNIPGRFASLLRSRRAASRPLIVRTTTEDTEVTAALSLERNLRQQAEKKINLMNSELEDLTVQLFSQANEMVADERRARAKLESRIKILEERDREKGKRLERLEAAVMRIHGARRLLVP